MSLKPLILDQTLTIDDHKWGTGEETLWDVNSKDIHIDKKTKYPIDGKKQNVRIRIPINSNNKISIQNKKKKLDKVPRKLEKEIIAAFEDEKKRNDFIGELIPILINFKSNLDSIDKAGSVLNRISKHFGLEWTTQTIGNYLKGALIELTHVYQDKDGQYYITINSKKIKLGNVDRWVRQNKNIKRC